MASVRGWLVLVIVLWVILGVLLFPLLVWFVDNLYVTGAEWLAPLLLSVLVALLGATVLTLLMAMATGRVKRSWPWRRGRVVVKCSENGPNLVIVDGKAVAALCRCGQSSNKPYCDATHKKIGFSAKAVELRVLE
ncbi:CDGSH iron-sulfur domain-containing protein [[Eubacterium] cellulosolvens]